MSGLRELCCPKPDELVGMYRDGSSIDSLIKHAYRSRMFVKKQNAREYVYRVIYDYHIKQKHV